MSAIKVNCENIEISNNNKICIIAGPCQLETEQHALDMAGKIKEITSKFGLGFIYKTSFDKANRTSLKGKRGAGLDASLPVFDKIKKELPEIIELKNHPWFIGVQFHPEFKSRPLNPHPLFSSFIKAAKNHR